MSHVASDGTRDLGNDVAELRAAVGVELHESSSRRANRAQAEVTCAPSRTVSAWMLQRRVFGEGEQFDDVPGSDRGHLKDPPTIRGDEIVTVPHQAI
jgi:hypothetical protein